MFFLPNIYLHLYAFISFMEDSGLYGSCCFYYGQELMHKIGLHGKSFIPLLLWGLVVMCRLFWLRAPSSRSSRMITMLINPLMSCSARLPIYILFVSAFSQSCKYCAVFDISIWHFAGGDNVSCFRKDIV